MSYQHTSTSSAESSDSPLPRSGQDSGQSPSAKSIPIARKSSRKTLWPTPTQGDSKSACNATATRHNPASNHHAGTTLTDAIRTSSTSTELNTEAATSSQADFLASHSALPGSDEARRMTVISGRRCCVLLRKQDPLGCLARTFLESSRWNSTTCFLTWKDSDLEGIGYATRPFVIPACAVDARHRRNRLWIVCRDVSNGNKQGVEGRISASVRECSSERSTWSQDSFTDTTGESTRRIAISRSECCEWLPEPDVGRVAHGIPARVDRLRGLGNAIVPQVAFEILREIRALI
jgi:hypothetical protein